MFLENNNIYLKPIEKYNEFETTFNNLNKQKINKYLSHGDKPITFEEVIDNHRKQYNNSIHLAIYKKIKISDLLRKSYTIHVGNIHLRNINEHFRTAEISILIWDSGKGYATQAIKLITKHAFTKMNLNRLQAGTVAKNIGCIKAFEKNDFIKEAVLRQKYFCDGEYQDVVIMRLLKEEWTKWKPEL